MDCKEKAARKKILLFGGTSEGRELAEALLAEGYSCTVCVATEYGAHCLMQHPRLEVRTGRMGRAAMTAVLSAEPFACAVDATHPHAAVVSGEIRAACADTDVPYLRFQRDIGDMEPDVSRTDPPFVIVDDMGEAAEYLAQQEGVILATTGSKEIERLALALGDPSRLVARVLPSPASLEACLCAGLKGKQIVAMQGPFDTEMNCALLRRYGASWLLTKETGRAGGFPEKIEAARKCGAGVVVIRSPEQAADAAGDIEKKAETLAGILDRVRELAGAGGSRTAEEMRSLRDPSDSAALSGEDDSAVPSGEDDSGTDNRAIEEPAPEQETEQKRGTGKKQEQETEQKRETGKKQEQETEQNQETGQDQEEQRQQLTLVGIGVGAFAARTYEAQGALETAQVIFGAPSVVRQLRKDPALSAKKIVWMPFYESRRILTCLKNFPQIRRAAVAYSGDSGFYSGAASMMSLVQEVFSDSPPDPSEAPLPSDRPVALAAAQSAGSAEAPLPSAAARSAGSAETFLTPESVFSEYRPPCCEAPERDGTQAPPDIRLVCGVSSISWFAAKAGIPWQDMKILSSHGRECNVVGQVRRHPECFLLLSGAEDLARTGMLLEDAQKKGVLGDLKLIFGYNLSRPDEEIRECTAAQLCGRLREGKYGLYVLYIRHKKALETPVAYGLPDTAFTRGKVPMTSSEVRAISLGRLRLTARPVLYDVGAGTGSVSVEAALACPEAAVYSIERNEKAVALLRENRDRYCLSNMRIIEGEAPEALRELPPPTHAFIGGSGGNLEEILRLLLQKNPSVRIVVNCITMETLAQIRTALETLPVCDIEWTQVSAARGDTLGRYHYLRAQNPVFVISFAGKKPDCR